MNLTQSQKWLAAIFLVSILMFANTLFVTGDVQLFIYVVIGICFAFFSAIMSNSKSKNTE